MIRSVAGALCLVLVGCATAKRDLNLERLGAEWQQASFEERELAPVEAAQVDRLLVDWRAASTTREREQLAYLVERRITLYQTAAALARDKAKLEALQEENRDLQLAAARQETERAHLEAEKMRLQSVADSEIAERALRDAEASEAARLAETEAAELARSQADAATQLALLRTREAELAQREAELRGVEVKSLRLQLAGLRAQKTERGMALIMGDVFFASGQGALKPEARDNLAPVLEFIAKYPKLPVSIEGHTDSRGAEATNLALSQRRAESVRLALLALGAQAAQLRAYGLGESQPTASNDSSSGRAANRRVEIVVIGATEN